MNTEQAAEVVNYMLGANLRFTPQPFEPTHMAVWYDHMREVKADDGAEAARRIVESDTDWPSFARFRQVAKVVERENGPSLPAPGTESAPYTCRCLNTGLIEELTGMRPCGDCNPAGYERWRKGRYRPKFMGQEAAEVGASGVKQVREALDAVAPRDEGVEW